MKILSETRALETLHDLKTQFAARIRHEYEDRAKDCSTCETRGVCCLDSHFVNVHITRLEANAIRRVIDDFPAEKKDEILDRIDRTIATYELAADGDTFEKTYACPLFEKGIGCLVHERGKPLACIAHACYENKEDLPPDDLLAEHEGLITQLNELTYRTPSPWLPLPVAVGRTVSSSNSKGPTTD